MQKLNSVAENQNLPNKTQAISLVCRCFGAGIEELNRILELKRGFNPEPYKDFPKAFSGTTLMRAKANAKKEHIPTTIIQCEALYDRIRRQHCKPLWSFTARLSGELVSSLLNLYERFLPKLNFEGVARTGALWLLVENVIVPTVFIKLVQEWRFGLGNEFLGDVCWYLPIMSHGKIEKPLPRVLDYWMRVAGFQTAYQVAKAAGEQSLRRKIDRWLKEGKVPDPSELHRLVNKFAANVAWLDEPDTWKARFTLACAMQNVCDLMDEYFKPIRKSSSLALIKMIRSIPKDHIVCDDEKFLAGAGSFFAARLLQRRLQSENKWNPNPPSDGNWFLEEIRKMAIADGFLKGSNPPVENYVMLEEYLFGVGVRKLNCLFESKLKKGRRALARRP